MSSKTRNIYCPNGSLASPSNKNITCPSSDKDCFSGSYKYCKPLQVWQIVMLIVIGLVGLSIVGVVVKALWFIPLLNLVVNLGLLAVTVVIIYMVYENYRVGNQSDNKDE